MKQRPIGFEDIYNREAPLLISNDLTRRVESRVTIWMKGTDVANTDWSVCAGRDVMLAVDDYRIRENIRSALKRLEPLPGICSYTPEGESKKKRRPDDTAEVLAAKENGTYPYVEGREMILCTKWDGTCLPITNFRARIETESAKDDGSENDPVREFEIAAVQNGETKRCKVRADQLGQVHTWTATGLGAGFAIGAGQGEKFREALHLLSRSTVVKRTVYTHSGWRQLGDDSVYCFHGGAIGGDGVRSDLLVDLELPKLHAFSLPAPGENIVELIAASTKILRLGPDRMMMAPWAAIWRSVLSPCDFSIHLDGDSGSFKTETATLCQQHFGAGFNSRALPTSWHSTALGMEMVAFIMKEAICVVDDFKPIGTAADRSAMHKAADALFRAAGNQAGRDKLKSDSTFMSGRPPRGLILSTGEETPSGQSLGARLFVVAFERGLIDKNMLTICQKMAAAGMYAQLMSAFLKWLAPRRKKMLETMPVRIAELRDQAANEGHPRTAAIVANLFYGLLVFLRFAKEAGFPEDRSNEIQRRAWNALLQIGAGRDEDIKSQQPVERFFDLLNASLAAGRAHIQSAATGTAPLDNPERWGWRVKIAAHNITGANGEPKETEPEYMVPGGSDCVGFLDYDDLYLIPDSSYLAAQKMASGRNDIGVEQKTLAKRLMEQKLLVKTGYPKRKTPLVRLSILGAARQVLHLKSAALGAGDGEENIPTLEGEV